MIVLIAIATMIAATLAQHLGLAEAIARIVDKVASCPQCFTFWATMSALLYLGHDVYASALSAIVVAYLSNWFVLLLLILQRKFTKLYEKERHTTDRLDH
nr:MAG TPA: RecR protein [Caudoviricetes sp.]